jgi:hypothetical protein
MKKSNIILVTFLMMVFLTPLFIAMALSVKVRKGEFTTERQREVVDVVEAHQKKLKTGEYSVLTVKGNTPFHCSVIKADSSYIVYESYEEAKLQVNNVNDTLHVVYNNFPDGRNSEIKVYMRSPKLIVGEKTVINLNSSDFYKENDLQIQLRNGASLGFFHISKPLHSTAEVQSDTSNRFSKFSGLAINSNGSTVFLPSFVKVENLSLDFDNESKLIVDPEFQFGNVSGTITDDTRVEGPWSVVKKLKTAGW